MEMLLNINLHCHAYHPELQMLYSPNIYLTEVHVRLCNCIVPEILICLALIS